MATDFLLLTPGPTNVPKRILDVTALPIIHHRTKDFQAVLERVNAKLKQVFMTSHPVMFFASSGTGAMEASLTNLFSPGDAVISISAGKWGERYRDIARAFGLSVTSIEIPYGSAIDPETVREALAKNPTAKAVLMTLCETSTAVTHPVKEIAAITKTSGALLLVDAISGLACDELRTDLWGVDVVVSGSQKGLMLPPGLSFISVNDRAQKLIASSKLPKYYFNFAATLKAMQKNDTPYTPAVSLVRGLDEALTMLIEEGIENVWKRHSDVARLVRERMTKLGYELFSKRPSNGLTAMVLPSGIQSKDVIKIMRDEHHVIMADGQGELQGKIVRFAHMGYACTIKDAEVGIRAFEDAMQKVKAVAKV